MDFVELLLMDSPVVSKHLIIKSFMWTWIHVLLAAVCLKFNELAWYNYSNKGSRSACNEDPGMLLSVSMFLYDMVGISKVTMILDIDVILTGTPLVSLMGYHVFSLVLWTSLMLPFPLLVYLSACTLLWTDPCRDARCTDTLKGEAQGAQPLTPSQKGCPSKF